MSYLGIIFLLDYKELFHVFRLFLEMPLNIDQPLESVCLMAMMTLSRAIICPI